jgi:hypothetical protein
MKENSENRRSKQTKQTKLCWKTSSIKKYDKHLESRDLCQIMHKSLLGVYPIQNALLFMFSPVVSVIYHFAGDQM